MDRHMACTHRRLVVVVMLALFIIEISSHSENSALKGV